MDCPVEEFLAVVAPHFTYLAGLPPWESARLTPTQIFRHLQWWADQTRNGG